MSTVLKRQANTNVNDMERWISLVGGSGLVAYGIARRDKAGAGLAVLGGAMLWRGYSGHCHMYQKLGVNTARGGHEKGTGSAAGVPYELGIRIDHEVRIDKPVGEVYRFWRKLENLPRFMEHLEIVREVDNRVSHWVARGPAGVKVEWDAEIVNEIDNQVIGWRSLPGSQVDNGGSVRFEEAGDGTTIVRVSLQYNPPAGTVGAMVARVFGEDPRNTIREDLQRFKELMETGAIASRDKRSSGESEWRRRNAADDPVQGSSEESFPASDAPSWTPEAL